MAADEWQRTADSLERIVKQNPDLFSDPREWIRGMIRAMFTVCRIEKPEGRAWGTGFLLGPDLVITNNHVVCDGGFAGSPDQVRCRFGFQTRTAGSKGQNRTYSLAEGGGWLAYSSPVEGDGLDYALLRLASKAGLDRIDDLPTTPQRGWVRMAATSPVLRQSLFILQHPGGDTLKLADGGLQAITTPWVCYDPNTEYGSSGSPVFDNRWELVALHSRRDPGEPVNRGILFSAILQNLPEAIRDEIRRSVPPPNSEVGEELLERHDLSLAKIDVSLVEAHLARLEGGEMGLLAGAVLEVARKCISERDADGTCSLGSGRRLIFRVNRDAITMRGQVIGLQGTLELVQAHEEGLTHQRQQQQSGLYPGINYPALIARQKTDLEDAKNELRGKLRYFLDRLRIESGE
jgi:hypothetical protein